MKEVVLPARGKHRLQMDNVPQTHNPLLHQLVTEFVHQRFSIRCFYLQQVMGRFAKALECMDGVDFLRLDLHFHIQQRTQKARGNSELKTQ